MYNNILGPSGSNNEELTVNNMEVNDISKTNENDGNKSPKKKGKVVLIVILVLLLMGGMGFCGWKLGVMYATYQNNKEVKEENKNNAEEKTDESNTDKKEIVELEKNSKYTFKKEYKSNVTLNDKNMEIITFYYVDLVENEAYEAGNFKKYYEVRADVYVNNKKIADAHIVEANEAETIANSFINTFPNYETKELKDVSNNDKYLLLFLESSYFDFYNGYDFDTNCYVIKDDASVLATIPVDIAKLRKKPMQLKKLNLKRNTIMI